MSNAVLYFHSDAYETRGARLMGRHSAGESFLRGFLRYADVDTLHFWNVANAPLDEAEALIRRIQPFDKSPVWHRSRRRLGDVGVLSMPVPGLPQEAWARRHIGDQAYAISGVTHTTASVVIMQTVADMLLSPLYDYDALICTSSAVRASIETQLDGMRDYIEQEYGPRRRAEAQRVVIPLGVNVDDFRTDPAQRRAWREKLAIPDDAIVALYVGRFSPRGKMNPALMAQALEQAARRTTRPIYWVNSGWTTTEAAETAYREQTSAFCPSVHFRIVDGRDPDVRFSIWSVADVFISFSDNIQETFGLTPIEAMAAGLPCVVTDWDGYRDTVRDGEDGYRIATYAPRPGDGGDIAYAFADGQINYDAYIGGVAQYTAIDIAAAAQAIHALVENPDLRARMGRSAQGRARNTFDWSVIIPQYQALWAEQNARRRTAPLVPAKAANPFRPDPFTLFGGYPTQSLQPDWQVAVPPGVEWTDARSALTSALAVYSALHRPTMEEAQKAFEWALAYGPAPLARLVEAFPPHRRPFVQRGLLWMARFGALALNP